MLARCHKIWMESSEQPRPTSCWSTNSRCSLNKRYCRRLHMAETADNFDVKKRSCPGAGDVGLLSLGETTILWSSRIMEVPAITGADICCARDGSDTADCYRGGRGWTASRLRSVTHAHDHAKLLQDVSHTRACIIEAMKDNPLKA